MTMKHGTYLGGIRTVADLRARCRISDETGCWHWGLAFVQGAPSVHFVINGKRQKTKGRRAALLIAGKTIEPGHHAFANGCESDDCVNPAHCQSGDRMAAGAALAASGRIKNLPTKIAASRKNWDGRRKIDTPEKVAEIRSSSESNEKLAKRLGVSAFAIWSCRVGQTHKQVIAGASAFTWRPA